MNILKPEKQLAEVSHLVEGCSIRSIERLTGRSRVGAGGAGRMIGAPALITRYGVLYEADCMDLFAALKDESVHCVFADPPFNLGKDYRNGISKDDLSQKDYLKWSFAWVDECVRVVRPGGALFIYILPQWGYHFASHLEERGMRFRHWIRSRCP